MTNNQSIQNPELAELRAIRRELADFKSVRQELAELRNIREEIANLKKSLWDQVAKGVVVGFIFMAILAGLLQMCAAIL
jgi:hypothetical protein